MRPKAELYDSYYAAWFKDPDVIAAYPSRPPYARVAIEFLSGLVTDRPRRVLDIGCGTGDIARRLGPLADRVDAVDFSAGDDRRQPTICGRRVGFTIGAHTELRDAPPQLEAVVAGSGFRVSRRAEVPYAQDPASCSELSGSTAVSAIEPAGAAAGVIEIAPRYGH